MMTRRTTTVGPRRRGSLAALTMLLLVPVATSAAATAPQEMEKEIYRGIMVAMGTVARGANSSLNIHITEWTSPSQRQVLLNALVEGSDEDSLVNVLRVQPEKGFLQVRNEPGTLRLKYAWQTVADDGSRTITLIADNLLPIFITQGNMRAKEKQFTIVTLDVDADGAGSGSVAAAASITWDAEARRIKIGIESTEPIRMTSVTKVQ